MPHPVDGRFFNPTGIAIVGATTDSTRIGGQPLRALTCFGYQGNVYPVNPRHAEIAGLRAYPSVRDIKRRCDLAVIAVPASKVPEVLIDCGSAGIPYAIVLSAGFRETGESGRLLEEETLRAARRYDVRLLGPNCQGLLNLQPAVYAGFGAPFQDSGLPCGPIALVTQSGGFGFSIVMALAERQLGFRVVVSTGNESDITTPELVSVLADDPNIEIICVYLEGVKDGPRLIEALRKSASLGKPVLIWKAGNTREGASAAASHTAQLTGSYEAYRSAFKQSGAIEVGDIAELCDACAALLSSCVPAGPRVGSIGISGGAGIVLADRLPHANLLLASLTSETTHSLQAVMPPFASARNPVDVTASVFNDPTLIDKALETVARDPGVDVIAVLLASLPTNAALPTARVCADVASRIQKPVLVSWTGRNRQTSEAYAVFQRARIPLFDSPGGLAVAAGRLVEFHRYRRSQCNSINPHQHSIPSHDLTIPTEPDEANILDLLEAIGIPAVTRRFLCVENGEQIPDDLVYPVALKLVSPDIPHKSEVGGVKLGIESKEALQKCMDQMLLESVPMRCPGARIRGLLVAPMIRGALELIVGMVRDPTFGPLVTVGLGGTLAELLDDTASRLAPFDEETAREMLQELRAVRMLGGYRGSVPRDIDALVAVLVRLSEMAIALPSIAELEINPLFVMESGGGVWAGDALAVLSNSGVDELGPVDRDHQVVRVARSDELASNSGAWLCR